MIGVLAIVWILIPTALWWIEARKPAESKVIEFLQGHPLTRAQSNAQREELVRAVAGKLNRLHRDDRLRVLLSPSMQRFTAEMEESERVLHLELTALRGQQEMAEGFSHRPADKQARSIEVVLEELDKLQPGARVTLESILTPQAKEQIIRDGLPAYLKRSNLLAKIRLQPFLEKLQEVLQRP